MLDRDVHEGVAILTMNRPRQRNAMSADLVAGLLEACAALDGDESVRAVVLTGAAPGFCAGSDLGGLAAMDAASRCRFERDSGKLARRIAALAKPVVAAVSGFAIGGGLTLAAACDVVITGPDSRWSLPEVPIGLFPAWGLWAVAARIGISAARRLSFGTEVLSGTAAVSLGLADCLAEGDVLDAAVGRARRLAALPPQQLAAVKSYFSQGEAAEASDSLANRHFMESSATPAADATWERFRRSRA